MISSVAWVPRGAAKRDPLRQELSADELALLQSKAVKEVRAAKGEAVSDDEDDDTPKQTIEQIMSDPAFASLQGVKLPKEFQEDDEDDMVGAAGAGALNIEGDDEDDASDAEDYVAKPSDVFLLAANTEEDFSSLEVYCFNTEDGSLYVHHDITLPAFPLSLAWMDYAGEAAANSMMAQTGQRGSADTFVGSYVAVGTFKTDIEIWNLDVIDPLEPSLVLKGTKKSAVKKAGKEKEQKSSGGHSDAVISLSWNREHRNLLASGSADKTVKLWDIDTATALHTFSHHLGKVQTVAWHPNESTVLASASTDRTLAVWDARDGATAAIARYAAPSDPESLSWNVHAPEMLVATCEDGTVIAYDARRPDTPLWNFKAHAAATTSISFSCLARGLFATCSLDKHVKLYDWTQLSASGAPSLVATKEMSIGQIFTVSFFPHSPFLLAAGGSKGVVAIWDVAQDAGQVPATAPAISETAAMSAALPEDVSHTARRFADRLVDPSTLEAVKIRPREDGQLIA